MTWHRTTDTPPPDGVIVETKIDDASGERNRQKLYRSGSLWFTVSHPITYVYYTPTHWRNLK